MPISLESPNVDNYAIGKGICSVKLISPTVDADFVDIGNVPEFEFTPTIERLDHFSSRGGVREKDRSVVVEKGGTLRMVMEEWTARNLAMALMSSVTELSPDGSIEIDIFSENVIVAEVRFVGTNEIGPQFTWNFPRVEFAPSAAINPISDEWGQLEVSGEVVAAGSPTSFGKVTATFPAP